MSNTSSVRKRSTMDDHSETSSTPKIQRSTILPVTVENAEKKAFALIRSENKAQIKKLAKRKSHDSDAQLLALLYPRSTGIVFDFDKQKWYIWNGSHWCRDDRKIIHSIIARILPLFSKRSKERKSRHTQLGMLSYQSAVLKIAEGSLGVHIKWNQTPLFLSVTNGTLDLRTGELNPSQPEHFFNCVVPVKWQGLDTPAPLFEKFMCDITGQFEGRIGIEERKAIALFLQEMLGYSLSGTSSIHNILVLVAMVKTFFSIYSK